MGSCGFSLAGCQSFSLTRWVGSERPGVGTVYKQVLVQQKLRATGGDDLWKSLSALLLSMTCLWSLIDTRAGLS